MLGRGYTPRLWSCYIYFFQPIKGNDTDETVYKCYLKMYSILYFEKD